MTAFLRTDFRGARGATTHARLGYLLHRLIESPSGHGREGPMASQPQRLMGRELPSGKTPKSFDTLLKKPGSGGREASRGLG